MLRLAQKMLKGQPEKDDTLYAFSVTANPMPHTSLHELPDCIFFIFCRGANKDKSG
jgi:hypothetical protein